MADLTNAQKAQILVDGEPITEGATSTALVIVGVEADAGDGTLYAVGNLAGTAAINVTKDGRNGSLEVLVTDAPLVVTLGAPEPK